MAKVIFSAVPDQPRKDVFSFHDRDTLLLVAKHDQLISRFDIKHLSGFCRNDDLSFFTYSYEPKNMFSLRRYAKAKKITALIFDQIVQRHTKQFCKQGTFDNIRQGFTSFP